MPSTLWEQRFARLSQWTIVVLIALLPLWFLPTTLDIWEVNKQALIVCVAAFLGCAQSLLLLASGMVRRRRGWIANLPFVLLVVPALSALFSKDPYPSWIGANGQEYSAVITYVALAILFWHTVQLFDTEKWLNRSLVAFLGGGGIALLIGLASLLDFSEFAFGSTVSGAFNSIGTVNAFGSFAAVLGVMVLSIWRYCARMFTRLLAVLAFLLAWSALAVIGYSLLWAVFLFGAGFAILLEWTRPAASAGRFPLLVPSFVWMVSLCFLLGLQLPVRSAVPVEITPSHTESWRIVREVWGERASRLLLGSGPGTFAIDFARYRSPEINQTPFWDTRFDRASSFLLTVAAAYGLLGLAATAAFVCTVAWVGWRAGRRDLIAPWAALVLAFAFSSANTTLLFVCAILSALILSPALSSGRSRVLFPRLSASARLTAGHALALAGAGMLATVFFLVVARYQAEAAFARAARLDRQNADLSQVEKALRDAVRMNSLDSRYMRNLASILQQLAVQETDPARQQAILEAALEAARQTTDQSPEQGINWLAHGRMARAAMGVVDGVEAEAIEALKRATVLDPAYPVGYAELGATYVEAAGRLVAQIEGKDEPERSRTLALAQTHLALAESVLARSIELKPDYAPAHFELAIVYARQGRLDEAVGKMESVLRYNPTDIGAMYQAALLYMQRGSAEDFNRAQAQLAAALDLSPSFVQARWLLSYVLERTGKISEAISHVQEILAIQSETIEAQERLAYLQSLQTMPASVQTFEPLPDNETAVSP